MTILDWKLTVRLSNGERFDVEQIPSNCSVPQFKARIESVRGDFPAIRQRLVYKGRILDDNQRALSDYGIVDKATVFLVLGKPAAATPAATTATTPTPPASNNSPIASLYSAMAGGAANPWGNAVANNNSNINRNNGNNNPAFPGAAAMPNPDQMQQMMNSPMMQSLMDNPELMRNMLQSSMQTNPQMQQLLDSNPQLRQMWADPAILDQAIQMMRNPSAMQQAMRQQDLAMSQLENMPGGFRALSNMYRDIQEPMMEAQDEERHGTGQTPNAASASQGEGARGTAMPNPWGSPAAAAPAPRAQPSTAMPNPWGGAAAATPGNNASGNTSMTPPAASNPWAGAAAGAGGMPSGMPPGMPRTPQDMEQMLNVMDNPMMRQMMDQMVQQNPGMIRSLMEVQNPMLRDMFTQNPAMADNMIRQMMNPDNLRAMMQMQQSFGGASAGGMPAMPGATPGAAPGLDFSSLLGGGGMGANRAGGMPPMDFGSMMQQLQGMQTMGGGAGATNNNANANMHPADRFRSQLQQLRDMGFDDEQAALAALQTTNGNLNRAVDHLLSSPAPTPAPTPAPAATAQQEQQQQQNQPDAPKKDDTEKKND